MCSTGVAPVLAVVTGGVLQAEAGLVALGHRVVGAGIQQLVVAELVHAVEVPVESAATVFSNIFNQRRMSNTSIWVLLKQTTMVWCIDTRGCFCS